MTPNTQSVCKHCGDLDREFAHLKSANTGAWQYRNEHGHWVTCETQRPVAEPASTGEPPHIHTKYCYQCSHDDCPCHGGYLHEQPMCIPAARPSEPSAPQPTHCQECHEVITFNDIYKQWFHADGTSTYPKCTRPKPAPNTSAELSTEGVRFMSEIHEHFAPKRDDGHLICNACGALFVNGEWLPPQSPYSKASEMDADEYDAEFRRERVALLTAHRACTGLEHDPSAGKLHGYCIVCGVPWPCSIVAPQPVSDPAPSPTPSVSTGPPSPPPYWMVTRFETLVRMVDRGTQDTSALEEYLELRKKLRELAAPSVAGTQPTPEERELLLAQFFPQGTPQVEERESVCGIDTPHTVDCGCVPNLEEIVKKQFPSRWFRNGTVEELHPQFAAAMRAVQAAVRHGVGAPAQQTPPLENVLDVIGGLIATYETGDHADKPCGNCVICTAEKILEELATPASTARTDGWVSVEDGLPKTTGVYGIYPPEQIDKDQGLNFSPRYFFANEDRNTYVGNKLAYGWVKDKNHKVTHWRELPAAPGSVPQAEPPSTKSFLGLPVYVDNPQFTGYGMAAYDSGDRKRVIGVLLENGNTWEYDAATVREARHEELPKMPRFIRERFKPWSAQPGDAPQKEQLGRAASQEGT